MNITNNITNKSIQAYIRKAKKIPSKKTSNLWLRLHTKANLAKYNNLLF